MTLIAVVTVGVIPLLGLFVYSEFRHSMRSASQRTVGRGDIGSEPAELAEVNRHERDWDDADDKEGQTDDLEFEVGGGKRGSDASLGTTVVPVHQDATIIVDAAHVSSKIPPPSLSTTKYHGPRKLLLVCLFTGGVSPVAIKEKSGTDGHADNLARVNARVDAQVASWAADDVDVYHVTHANVSNPRVIRLPEEAESGGYKGLWLKTLLLFDYLANSDFGRQ